MSNDDERDYAGEADVREQAVMEGALEQAAYHAEDVADHKSGPAHYREAEIWLASAEQADIRPDEEERFLRFAKVHALLALTAATAANIRRNGAVNRANVDVDPAAGWPEVLG